MSNPCSAWTRAWLPAAAAAALLLAAAPATAEEPPAPAAGPAAPIAWSSLTPMQQKVLSRFGSQWNSLPPERQQALETRQDLLLHRRSEEHTSELQSPYDIVCRLLLEKKKKYVYIIIIKQ